MQKLIAILIAIHFSCYQTGCSQQKTYGMDFALDIRNGLSSHDVNWPVDNKEDTWNVPINGGEFAMTLHDGDIIKCHPDNVIFIRSEGVVYAVFIQYPPSNQEGIVKQVGKLWPQLKISDESVLRDISSPDIKKKVSGKYVQKHFNNLKSRIGRTDGISSISIYVSKTYIANKDMEFQCHIYLRATEL
ncbi:MAG: hypothetical protein ACO1RA_00170 [Planctomycetaceae bacterium]